MIWRKRYNGNLWGEQEDYNCSADDKGPMGVSVLVSLMTSVSICLCFPLRQDHKQMRFEGLCAFEELSNYVLPYSSSHLSASTWHFNKHFYTC